MTGQEVEQIAAAVADQLQASVLQLPAVVTDYLQKYAGACVRYPLTHDLAWPVYIETQVLTDGGLRLVLLSADGSHLFERVLSR